MHKGFVQPGSIVNFSFFKFVLFSKIILGDIDPH